MSGFAPSKSEQPVTEATRACILRIGLDHLVAAAQYDGYLAAILADYRRLKAEDIGSRPVPPVVDVRCHSNSRYRNGIHGVTPPANSPGVTRPPCAPPG